MSSRTCKQSAVANPDRVYWDSCTYLDWLTGEHELHADMDLLMEDWRAGLVTLVTSALTIAEVYFVRVSGRVQRSRDADIDALFNPPLGVNLVVVELNRLTAFVARDLARDGISPADAIHVASALEGRCPIMHTNDDALWLKSGKVGGDPTLKIAAPSWMRQLSAFEDSSELAPPSSQSPNAAQS